MAKKATKLSDIGDERDQKVFLAVTQVFHNGDLQAALDHYNKSQEELDELEKQPGVVSSPFDDKVETRLHVPRQ